MYIEIKDVTCPQCGDHIFEKSRLDKGVYRCCHLLYEMELFGKKKNVVCSHCQCLCKTCNKIYDETEFGRHGDVWECKNCGTVQWGYTDYMREKEGIMEVAQRINSKSLI